MNISVTAKVLLDCAILEEADMDQLILNKV